jgi:hypothetical protein
MSPNCVRRSEYTAVSCSRNPLTLWTNGELKFQAHQTETARPSGRHRWGHPTSLQRMRRANRAADAQLPQETHHAYDFMGDNARRFMGLPIANPDPAAVKPPAMANA